MKAVQLSSSGAHQNLQSIVARLKENSPAFAGLSLPQRIALLEQMRAGYREIAEQSVLEACRAKGIQPRSPIAGEEWLAGPTIVTRNLRLLRDSLRQIQAEGAPRVEKSWIHTLPDGRLSIRVFPINALDRVLLPKHSAEAWMGPGITASNLKEHQAPFYRRPHSGKVCLVLGAGNVNSIPPTDCAYKMFVEGKVCLLKMNPVNAYLGPLLERAFAAAVDRGFFAVAYGGVEEGEFLVNHPQVDEVHITGSDKTHDLLVWGPPGPEREARKSRGEPLLRKSITSELGNISPVVVVPAPYAKGELVYQARDIAGMVVNNASFNCNSAKLLVTARGWEQRPSLLASVETALRQGSVRTAYYPGAEERWRQFTSGRSGLRLIGTARAGELPFAIIPDVDPAQTGDRVFTQEPWCSVLSETALPGSDPVSFLENAVRFLNEKVWGTLCATLIVHPRTLADPSGMEAVEKAIRDLRYGAVAVNTWPAAVFALGSAPWGAHPSGTLQDIQSGRGWVHNTFMLEGIEKCVLRAPLTGFPISPWFPGHRTLEPLARQLVDFEMHPSWAKVPRIAFTAMRA